MSDDIALAESVVVGPFKDEVRAAEGGTTFELQPDLLGACECIVPCAVKRWQQRRGDEGDGRGVHVRHRFGGSLDIHVHAHRLPMDGRWHRGEDTRRRRQDALAACGQVALSRERRGRTRARAGARRGG